MLLFRGSTKFSYIVHKTNILKCDGSSIYKVEKADSDIVKMVKTEVIAVAVLKTEDLLQVCFEQNDCVISNKFYKYVQSDFFNKITHALQNISLSAFDMSENGYSHYVYLFHMSKEAEIVKFIQVIKGAIG